MRPRRGGRARIALLPIPVLALFTGCGGGDAPLGPEAPDPPEPSPVVKGIALSPQGFPETFDGLQDFLAEAASFPDAGVFWNGAWRDDVAGGTDAGIPPAGATLVAQASGTFGYAPILAFGWRGEAGPHIGIPSDPENSWRNEAAAERFVSVVTQVAATWHPPFLFLGNESDAWFAEDPEDYARWVQVYERAYAAIKAASPETRVGPILQYERTAGIGTLAGMTEPRWGALTAHDPETLDVLGLTLYPFFAHATPEEIPSGYLAPLLPYLGSTPIAITETGWPGELAETFTVPWEASEAHQVAFLDALERTLAGREVALVNWLFLHPPAEPTDGSLTPLEWNLFQGVSLRRRDGEKRPVHEAWTAFSPAVP